jgi:fibronectin-binding autotransporter adhesin
MRGFPRVLVAGAVALGLGVVGVGSAHASGGCTDTWTNASGGSWDTAANWSAGVPTSSSSVCISAAGNYTVVVGNETITVANLTVGGTGATPTVQIGNGGASEPNITVSGTTSTLAGGTISAGWEGTYNFGTLSNAGTFLIPNSGFNSTFSFAGITNTGTFSAFDSNGLTLANGGTFDNGSTGTIDVADGTLGIVSPTAGSGTLELDSGSSVQLSAGAHLTLADKASVLGGSICQDSTSSFMIGSSDGGTGGTLAFATTPGTGPACGTGLTSDNVFITNTASTLSGTIPASYTVIAGDGGASFNNTTLSGNVVNDGTFEPGFGATIIGSGTTNELTNQGTLEIPASGYNTDLNTALANTGSVVLDANAYASLGTGQNWSNGTKGTNGTISITTGKVLQLSSPTGQSATFTQDGTITNDGTFNVADPIQINGGSVCGDALKLGAGDGSTGTFTLTLAAKPTKGAACAKKVVKGQLFIYNVTATINSNIPAGYTVAMGDGGASYFHVSTPGSLSNAGTLEPGWGGTFTVNGTLTNASTGKVIVPLSGYTTNLDSSGVTNSGAFTVDANLDSNASITNNKTLTITAVAGEGEPMLNITGTYTQGAKGTLVDPISGNGRGLLAVSGAASLAGGVKLTGKPAVKAGTQNVFMTYGSETGTFSKITGPDTLSYGATQLTATQT